MSTTAPDRCPSCGINYGYHLAGCAALSDGVNEEAPTATLTFHPFPQVQPPGGKELLLITSSKVFRKGDLYGGKQWRIDGDPGWNGKEYEYALKSLSDVIFWAELPDAVALANHSGVEPSAGWVEAGLVCQACAGDAPGGKCKNPKCIGGPIVREMVPAAGVGASIPAEAGAGGVKTVDGGQQQ